MAYASGHNAWAICDRCGLRSRRSDLVLEVSTKFRVHVDCEDYTRRHRHTEVREALQWTRPDREMPEDPPWVDVPTPGVLND